MKNGTYICVICEDCDTAETVKNKIAATYHTKGMMIKASELLIPVSANHGMGFSLDELRSLVLPCEVAMFDLENEADGWPSRWWY